MKKNMKKKVDIKVGMKCKVISNYDYIKNNKPNSGGIMTNTNNISLESHEYIVTIREIRNTNNNYPANNPNGRLRQIFVYENNTYYFEHELAPITMNLDYYMKKLKSFNEKIENVKNKISFIKENNISEYSDRKYLIYKGLIDSQDEPLSKKIEIIDNYLKSKI